MYYIECILYRMCIIYNIQLDKNELKNSICVNV